MNQAVALLTAGLFLSGAVKGAAGDVAYLSIDSLQSSFLEDFDSIGSAPNAPLPTGWRMGTSTIFETNNAFTVRSAGTTGLGALLSNSPAGLYNFADGENAISTDRAVGFLSDSNSVANKHLMLGVFNNTGATITELNLSYGLEKYRTGTKSADITLFYGYDNDQNFTWIEASDGGQHFLGDTGTAVVNPPSTINKAVALTNLTFANQGILLLRWQYSVASSVTTQAIGVDNFRLDIGPLQQNDLRWDGAPGATWDAVSTNWKDSAGGHVTWDDSIPSNANFVDGGAGVGTVITLASPRRAGTVTFDAGETAYTLNGAALSLKGSGGIGLVTKSSATINSPIVLEAAQQWDVSAGRVLSTSGVISGTSITKTGPGTLLLSAANTYGGSTVIQAGELRVQNTSGSATGSGAVTVNPGARLAGSGNVAGPVTVNGGAIAPAAGPGSLQIGSLLLNSGSSIQFDITDGGFHRLNIAGPLDVTGPTQVQIINPPQRQEFNDVLIDYSGPALSDEAFNRLNLVIPPCISDYQFFEHDAANTQIRLILHDSLGPPSWKGGSGSWADPCNWLGGTPSGAFYSGSSPAVVTLDGNQTTFGLSFNSSGSYTIAPPGSLQLNGGSVQVGSGSDFITAKLILPNNTTFDTSTGASLEISGELSMAASKTLQKTGRGTLKLSGPISFGSGTVLDVAAGTLRLNSNIAASGNPTTSINIHGDGSGSDALVVLGADQDWAGLTLTNASGKQGVDLNSPGSANGFRSLHIKASNLQSAKLALASSIRSALTTTGDGIFDSGLSAHPNSAVGISIVNNEILIRLTRIGDLNLDGRVTISDFIDLASNFNGVGLTWQEGDINYDGAVTISDFIDLASNFGSTYAGQALRVDPANPATLDDFAAAHGVAIPEPSRIALVLLASLAALRPRRLQFAK